MSSTNKTPQYNLSQFVDSDKPSWRGDYNADMSKIDTGIKGAVTQAQAATTIATEAKTSTQALSTKVTSVEATANNALSLAHTNETDISTNETTFNQYKTTVSTQFNQLDTRIEQLNQSLTSLTDLVDTKLTAPPEGYQSGSHMEMHFTQASWSNTFTPNGDPIWIPFADPTGNAVGKWANKKSAGVIELKKGTYLFTAHARINNVSEGKHSFKALFQLATTSTWFETGVLSADMYNYDLASSAPPSEGVIAAAFQLGETTSIRFGVKARGTGSAFTAVIGESHVQIVRLNDGTGSSRADGLMHPVSDMIGPAEM